MFTLSAAMLVGTPMTASAKDLNQIFKVEDPWGGQISDDDPDNTATGTVSATTSNSGVLNNQDEVLGIVLNKTDVNLEMYKGSNKNTAVLTATVLATDDFKKTEEYTNLCKALKWSSSDNKVVALESKKDGTVESMTLNAKKGGKAEVTVSLDSDLYDIHFKAIANVTVTQYAESLEFDTTVLPLLISVLEPGEVNPYDDDDVRNGYVGHSVDLNKAIIKHPETANDEITFEIKAGYDAKTKKDAVNVATLKNGILTYKKAGNVTIVAVGERGAKKEVRINIHSGSPASKVEIWSIDDSAAKLPKVNLDVAEKDQRSVNVQAVVYTKDVDNGKTGLTADHEKRNKCTDQITWSSKKETVAVVTPASGTSNTATIIPTGVGSTQITALSSTGKKATLTVKVDATMTDIEITIDADEDNVAKQALYSGQSVTLTADTYFGEDKAIKNFPGAGGVTWSIANSKEVSKYASVKKDVLTLKPTVDTTKKIEIAVKSAKKYNKENITPKAPNPATVKFSMSQANVSRIEVAESTEAPIAIVDAANKKNNKNNGVVTISGGKNRTYNVVAYDTDGHTTIYENGNDTKIPLASTLAIASSSEKLAKVSLANSIATVMAQKGNKGKATITVSGVTQKTAATEKKPASYAAIKTTFKANITSPTSFINLTTKSKAIVVKLKGTESAKQTVKYTATIDKKSTSKVKDIVWRASLLNSDDELVRNINASDIKNGSVTLAQGSYMAGQKLKVTAVLKDTDDKTSDSVSATVITPIVSPSAAVKIASDPEGKNIYTDGKKQNQTTIYLEGDKETSITLYPKVNVGDKKTEDWANPGKSNEAGTKIAADITYSVNKKGIVSIVDDEVRGIKDGTVKITVTTADNKKATLTVVVKKGSLPESAE